jgi:ATP-dependent DNA helicase RecG
LAKVGARCEIKLLVYSGTRIETSQIPNMRKSPRVFRGPLVELIDSSVRVIETELEEGITFAGSGFAALHRLPMRVVKEAIVNAVIHRDYRLNRDIFVRVFDNRIEIESPGGLPGVITPENIERCRSKARNPLIARSLFVFPVRPNVDAGEGVRMMFSEMEHAGLYPPLYRESYDAGGYSVTVVLIHEPRPPLWDLVSEWIDCNGPISNSVVCGLGKLHKVKASRMLKRWSELGLLQMSEGEGWKNRVYAKSGAALTAPPLISGLNEINR